MKVRLLASLCGMDKSYQADDEIDVSDKEALNLINSNLAVAKNKKAYEDLVGRFKLEEVERLEKESQLEEILYKEQLEKEEEKLLKRVEEIDHILKKTKKDQGD